MNSVSSMHEANRRHWDYAADYWQELRNDDDVYPFLRPWTDQLGPIDMQKPYTALGPSEDEDERGETVYEFHWRVSDLLNAIADSGLALKKLSESPAAYSRFWQGHSYRPVRTTISSIGDRIPVLACRPG